MPTLGDPSSIPGSGSSPGEMIGYLLQYSWTSLVAQMVKNLPAMQEMRAQPLAQEEPLEEEMTTPPSILAWRGPWPGGPGGLQSRGSRAKSRFEGLHHWFMLTLCYSAGYAHGLF